MARLHKNDSGDSNDLGDDLPIELRHLEDADELFLIPPLFGGVLPDQLSKSKSLNDITKLSPREKRKMRDQVSPLMFHGKVTINMTNKS